MVYDIIKTHFKGIHLLEKILGGVYFRPLEKICKGFDLTMRQFFLSETNSMATLTKQQRELLENWIKRSDTQKKNLLVLIDSMLQK